VILDEDLRIQDLQDALTFGNHKGKSAKPESLQKLIDKDVKYSHSIPILIICVMLIPGLCMAPMNIMAQNTIDKLGRIVPKNTLSHDQIWKWRFGNFINSHVQKELLQACCYLWFLHPSTCKLGSSSKKRISKSAHTGIKN
jgi:hypothetical protein